MAERKSQTKKKSRKKSNRKGGWLPPPCWPRPSAANARRMALKSSIFLGRHSPRSPLIRISTGLSVTQRSLPFPSLPLPSPLSLCHFPFPPRFEQLPFKVDPCPRWATFWRPFFSQHPTSSQSVSQSISLAQFPSSNFFRHENGWKISKKK